MANKIQWRRDTAANWTSVNPILADGMPGLEKVTCRLKIGDGVTPWNSLPYKFESSVVEAPAGTFTFTDERGNTTSWTEGSGGGGVTNHSGLILDDGSNPHGTSAADVGLGNVPNVDATDRANHTGTQLASSISDFAAAVASSETTSTLVESPVGTFTYTDEAGTETVFSTGGGSSGEVNTASNIGTAGVGVFNQKLGTDLQFKNINAGSTKVSITDDTANGEIDVDIVPANINTAELNNDANFIDAAGAPVQLADIADFETSAELDIRDTSNRNRANHTGTQTASTISDFATAVTSAETVTSLGLVGTTLTYTDEAGAATSLQLNVFGTEAEDFLDTSNTTIGTDVLFAVRSFTTAASPTGRYRIAMQVQLEPGSASNNYLFQLRINGVQIGLEMGEEGKDIGADNRNLRPLVGYYDHTGPGTFDIELWAAREGGSLILHGVSAEKWRVS